MLSTGSSSVRLLKKLSKGFRKTTDLYSMTNQEIKEIKQYEAAVAKMDADQALAADLHYRKEKFRQNFSIDALLYYKTEMLTRLYGYQSEVEFFRRQAEEATRKQDSAIQNISTTKDEIRAIEAVIAEKQAEIRRKTA